MSFDPVFRAARLMAGGSLLAVWLISNSHGAIISLVQSEDPEPGGTNTFSSLELPTINNAGQVGFAADFRYQGLFKGYGICRAEGGVIKGLVRTGQASPDTNGYFSSFNPESLSVNEAGDIGFVSTLTGTQGGGSDNMGVFRTAGTNVFVVAHSGRTTNSGGVIGAIYNGVRINNSGEVAFRCQHSVTLFALYRSTANNVLQRVTYYTQPSPDGNGNISVPGDPVINNNGQVAFTCGISSSTNSSTAGIYRSDGSTLTCLARSKQAVPEGNGVLADIPLLVPTLNDLGQVPFGATLSGTSGGGTDNIGVYRAGTGGLLKLARKGQLVPGGNGRFAGFPGSFLINNLGQVAFVATLSDTSGGTTDNAGIYLSDNAGNLTEIARKGQTLPGGNGKFAGFGNPVLNDKGEAVFEAALSNTAKGTLDDLAIYLASPGRALVQVAREGQAVAGSSLQEPHLATGSDTVNLRCLNDAGQVAFGGFLNNGNAGMFVWAQDKITSVRMVGPNAVLSWMAGSGSTNFIQAAPMVTNNGFVDISGPIVAPAGGMANYLDVGATTNKTQRYYRLRTLQ